MVKVLHEKCDKKLADNPKLPYNAYLIEYKEGEEHFFDIAIGDKAVDIFDHCLLYTSPSPRDRG